MRIADDRTKQGIGALPGRMRRKGRPIKASKLDSSGRKQHKREDWSGRNGRHHQCKDEGKRARMRADKTKEQDEQEAEKEERNKEDLKAGFEWNRDSRETEVEDIESIICIEMDRDGFYR